MPFKISRLEYFSGRPPGLVWGTKCLIRSHSLSLRSVGYCFRGSMPRCKLTMFVCCKLFKHPLSSTLYIFAYATDRLQQAIQVTSWGFYQVWGHEPMCKNYELPRNRAARQLRQPLKIVQSRAEGKSLDEQLWAVTPPSGFSYHPVVRPWAEEILTKARYDPARMLAEWEVFWRRKGRN
jgi:hypothetical protein